MLFNGNGDFMYDFATCKHIADILYRDDPAKLVKLAKYKSQPTAEALERECPELDGFESFLFFLKHTLNFSDSDISKFKAAFSEYMLVFREEMLPREYLSVPKAEEVVRRCVDEGLKRHYNIKQRLTDGMWSEVFVALRAKISQSSCNFTYNPWTDGIIGYLHDATANYFCKSIPDKIIKNITSHGLNQEIEGNDFGVIDYQSDEVYVSRDLTQFNLLASNVYRVTDFMYRHGGEVYYDMFSRYKFKRVQEQSKKIEKIITKAFEFAGIHTGVKVTDSNLVVKGGRNANAINYAIKKSSDRDFILTAFDPLLEGKAGLSDLDSMTNSLERFNEEVVRESLGKEGRPIFDTPVYKSKDKLSNDTKIEYIYLGVVALKKFIQYLKDNNVNVFSVPSDIFRSEKIGRRFTTFNRYMQMLHSYSEIIQEESESSVFISNDNVYLDLVRGSINVVNDIPLKSIKDVVDNLIKLGQAPAQPEYTNEIDEKIMRSAATILNAFSTYADRNHFVGKFALENEKHDIMKSFLMSNKLVTESQGLWQYSNQYDPEAVFKAAYQNNLEKLEVSMYFARLSGEKGGGQYLSYLRSVEVIRKFLAVIKELVRVLYRDENGELVYCSSKFQLFSIVNRNRQLFTIPSSPDSFDDISDLMDYFELEPYKPDNGDEILFNKHIIELYRAMYSAFKEVLDYAKKLYKEIFIPYSDGTMLDYVEDPQLKSNLRLMGGKLYYADTLAERPVIPNFERFKQLYSADPETGFMMKDGKLYTRSFVWMTQYLHERGYWVWAAQDGFESSPVSESDTFG